MVKITIDKSFKHLMDNNPFITMRDQMLILVVNPPRNNQNHNGFQIGILIDLVEQLYGPRPRLQRTITLPQRKLLSVLLSPLTQTMMGVGLQISARWVIDPNMGHSIQVSFHKWDFPKGKPFSKNKVQMRGEKYLPNIFVSHSNSRKRNPISMRWVQSLYLYRQRRGSEQ